MVAPTVRAVLVTVALAAAAVVPSAASAAYTIDTGRVGVRALGPFDTDHTRTYSPTVRAAARALGRPSNVFADGRGGCIGKWRRLGLRIVFTTFGGGEICRFGLAQSFSIERSRRWRTEKGLRIRMTQAELRRRHPRADWVDDSRFHPDGWWLRSFVSPFGDGRTREPMLLAAIRAGRVASFEGWIGAAGD